MRDARDITTVDEAAWTEAVARELVLRCQLVVFCETDDPLVSTA